MSNFQEIKEQLLTRRDEIVNRLEKVEGHLRHTEKPLEADFAEQATERENDEVLEGLDRQMRDEVTQINMALTRLEQNKYGVCERCGGEISAKRLEALPFASVCITCAA